MDIKKKYIKKIIDVNSEYGKKYLDIVSKGDTGEFTRLHHIIPVSYFRTVLGEPDARNNKHMASHESNLVALTDGRHLLAHYYLMKSAKKCIVRSMRRAFHVMYSVTSRDRITEKDVLKKMKELDNAYRALTRIEQWTKDGKLVAVHPTIQAAAIAVHALPPEISDVCRGKHPSAHGYVWVYEGTDPNTIHFPDIHGDNLRRRIAQYTMGGKFITLHESMRAAAKAIGVCQGSIELNLRGKSRACRGYVFAYENTPLEKINFPGDDYVPTFNAKKLTGKPKKVAQYDIEGRRICVYNSVAEAARAIHKDACCIYSCCDGVLKSSHGFRWSYHTRIKQLPPLIKKKSGPPKKEKRKKYLTRPI